MAKPSENLTWVSDDIEAKFIKPPMELEARGYNSSEQPDHRHFNWIFRNLYQWLKHFDEAVELIEGAQSLYDAFVGPGGTHADFNALMADPSIANIKRVMVRKSMALTETQIINANDIEIHFAAGSSIVKVLGATKAFSITGNKVRFIGARFDSWSGGGDLAIELTADSKNCLVSNCLFYNCTDKITDLGTNNIQDNTNRVEV